MIKGVFIELYFLNEQHGGLYWKHLNELSRAPSYLPPTHKAIAYLVAAPQIHNRTLKHDGKGNIDIEHLNKMIEVYSELKKEDAIIYIQFAIDLIDPKYKIHNALKILARLSNEQAQQVLLEAVRIRYS